MERVGGSSDHEVGGNDFENMMNRKRQENKRYRYCREKSRLESQRQSLVTSYFRGGWLFVDCDEYILHCILAFTIAVCYLIVLRVIFAFAFLFWLFHLTLTRRDHY